MSKAKTEIAPELKVGFFQKRWVQMEKLGRR